MEPPLRMASFPSLEREPDAEAEHPDPTPAPFKPTPLSVSSSSTSEASPSKTSSPSDDVRVSITSTSGTVYESVVVVRHRYGSDNVVYYLLDVRAWDAPLDGYVIKRRYSQFKRLHQQLAEVMPQRPTRSLAALPLPFGLVYSSLLCAPLRQTPPDDSPRWTSVTPRVAKTTTHWQAKAQPRKAFFDDEIGKFPENPDPKLENPENEVRYSAPAIMPSSRPYEYNCNYNYNSVELPIDDVEFGPDGRPYLPPMPSGGVASFFMSREALIQHRIEGFNKILAAALSDPAPAVARVLMTFIADNPRAQQGHYVSLNQYATIEMPWNVERVARQRAVSMGKKGLKEQMPVTPVAMVG